MVLFFVGVKFAQAADGCCYYTDNGGGCTTTKIQSECDLIGGTLDLNKDCNDDRTSCVDSTNTGSGNPPAATGSDPQGCCYWSLTDPNTGQQGQLDGNDSTKDDCQKLLQIIRAGNPGWTIIGNWSTYPCSQIVGNVGSGSGGTGSTGGSIGGNSSVKANLGGLSSTASNAGYTQRSIVEIISKILKALLSFVGVIFFILLIYGGVTFMTAAGNETQAKSAKGIITAAVIGLVVVIIAYAITTFVADSIIL